MNTKLLTPLKAKTLNQAHLHNYSILTNEMNRNFFFNIHFYSFKLNMLCLIPSQQYQESGIVISKFVPQPDSEVISIVPLRLLTKSVTIGKPKP